MTSTNGKYGVLEMCFERDSAGRSVLRHLHREVPMIVQQALYFDEQLPQLPCVYILSSGGPHLEGDIYRVEVELGEGAMAHISTGAATIIAPMEHERWVREHISMAWTAGYDYESYGKTKDEVSMLREQFRMHKLGMNGPVTSKEIRTHYDILPPDEQGKDWKPMESMLKLIKKYDGLRIYRLN